MCVPLASVDLVTPSKIKLLVSEAFCDCLYEERCYGQLEVMSAWLWWQTPVSLGGDIQAVAKWCSLVICLLCMWVWKGKITRLQNTARRPPWLPPALAGGTQPLTLPFLPGGDDSLCAVCSEIIWVYLIVSQLQGGEKREVVSIAYGIYLELLIVFGRGCLRARDEHRTTYADRCNSWECL